MDLDWHSNLVFVCFVVATSPPKKNKMSHEKGPFLKRRIVNHLPSIRFQALVSDKNPRMTTHPLDSRSLVGNWRDIFFTLKFGGVFWGTHLETTMACWKITMFNRRSCIHSWLVFPLSGV